MKERSVAGIAVDTLSLDPGNSPDFGALKVRAASGGPLRLLAVW